MANTRVASMRSLFSCFMCLTRAGRTSRRLVLTASLMKFSFTSGSVAVNSLYSPAGPARVPSTLSLLPLVPVSFSSSSPALSAKGSFPDLATTATAGARKGIPISPAIPRTVDSPSFLPERAAEDRKFTRSLTGRKKCISMIFCLMYSEAMGYISNKVR